MKQFIFGFFVLCFAFAKAQSLNTYQYVIVQDQYGFQNEPNQYRLNELMVFELEKYGMKAHLSSQPLPAALINQPCKALNLTVAESGFLAVSLQYAFKDCNGRTVAELEKVSTRIKDYQRAYYEATRESFQQLKEMEYAYQPQYDNTQNTPVMPAKESLTMKIPSPTSNSTDSVIVDVTPVQKTIVKSDATKKTTTETAVVEAPVEVDESVAPSTDAKQLTLLIDYRDPINGYELRFGRVQDNLTLYKQGVRVGSGRRSAAGAYLITTDSFTGIGFVEGENFIIEYDVNGSTQRVVMIK